MGRYCFITGRSMGYDMLHHLLVLNSLAGARSGKLNSTGVEGMIWGLVSASGRASGLCVKSLVAVKSAYLPGGVSEILGRFCPISPKMAFFGPRFSRFRLFSNFVIRYTRTEDGTLMYSSSPTRVKAPQLGPRGYRIFHFCPACVFGP
jgi:hypothetical protein